MIHTLPFTQNYAWLRAPQSKTEKTAAERDVSQKGFFHEKVGIALLLLVLVHVQNAPVEVDAS